MPLDSNLQILTYEPLSPKGYVFEKGGMDQKNSGKPSQDKILKINWPITIHIPI